MAYASWSVVFGEQPSASKWNILGTNDASFNDSTGINLQYANLTGLSNPYKFSAYRNAAQNVGTAATKVTFDVENYDTNNNFATGTYTAPLDGYYQFNVGIACTTAGTGAVVLAHLYVNGALRKTLIRMNDAAGSANNMGGSSLEVLTAGQTVEVYVATSVAAKAIDVGAALTYFNGYLVSRT